MLKAAAVDFEGNPLPEGTVSDDGTQYVQNGQWVNKGEAGAEDVGTFNITEAGILEVQGPDGQWMPYTGMYQGKEYFEGNAKDGLERVGPSDEFGTEEAARIEGQNEILNAEIDALIADTHNIITQFDSAKTPEELEDLNAKAIAAIAKVKGSIKMVDTVDNKTN